MLDHPIHRHCFIGTIPQLDEWAQFLPNCMFGITAKSLHKPTQRDVIKRIPPHRLLLETDSPHLIHRDAPNQQTNSPWQLLYLIREVATLRQVSPRELVEQCNDNARRLYRLWAPKVLPGTGSRSHLALEPGTSKQQNSILRPPWGFRQELTLGTAWTGPLSQP